MRSTILIEATKKKNTSKNERRKKENPNTARKKIKRKNAKSTFVNEIKSELRSHCFTQITEYTIMYGYSNDI